MPFHFKKAEPLDKGVRRVCREHLGEALKHLRKSRHPAAIHGVRKEIKKLRALLRLVQGGIGRGDYRKTENALCRAADRLAASRDARVMLQAFEQLAGGKAVSENMEGVAKKPAPGSAAVSGRRFHRDGKKEFAENRPALGRAENQDFRLGVN